MIERSIDAAQIEHISLFLSWLPLFQKVDQANIKELVEAMKLVYLEGGEALMKEGESERTLFVLWHGRLRVTKANDNQAEIIPGEVIGEISLLLGEPRSATVRAVRDSVLLKLDYAAFSAFERLHPHGVVEIAKTAISRLIQPKIPTQTGEKARTFAIAPAGNSDHQPFVRKLAEVLNRTHPTIVVNAEICNRHFGGQVAHAHVDREEHIQINSWISSLEEQYAFILLETDREKSPWTNRCFRQADSIYLVAQYGQQRRPNSIEEVLFKRVKEGHSPQLTMIFTRSNVQPKIGGTRHWLSLRPVHNYYHLNMESKADFARLVRVLTGEAFGVVLNGGGMRGFSHTGVLKALEELNIPVDYIGGCSMGSAIAGAYARVGLEGLIEMCHMKEIPKTSADYTFPAISLLKGKNVCSFYQKIYENDYIEDLQIPFFCVSTDLTHSHLHVHKQGLLWEAVRASTSIPAVFPPMYHSDGSMLVDGGLLNNMPVDVMRSCLMGGKILAVDCNIEPLGRNRSSNKPWLSGWQLILRQAFGSKITYDNIFKILRSSLTFSSKKKQESMKAQAEYLVEVETRQFPVLKVQNMDEIIEIGYRSAMSQLPAQLERD